MNTPSSAIQTGVSIRRFVLLTLCGMCLGAVFVSWDYLSCSSVGEYILFPIVGVCSLLHLSFLDFRILTVMYYGITFGLLGAISARATYRTLGGLVVVFVLGSLLLGRHGAQELIKSLKNVGGFFGS